jgi:hypothetical protein
MQIAIYATLTVLKNKFEGVCLEFGLIFIDLVSIKIISPTTRMKMPVAKHR